MTEDEVLNECRKVSKQALYELLSNKSTHFRGKVGQVTVSIGQWTPWLYRVYTYEQELSVAEDAKIHELPDTIFRLVKEVAEQIQNRQAIEAIRELT